MKQSNKKLNLTATFVLLIFAVLCMINVTYSYFTATAKATGSMDFDSINVSFNCSYTESNMQKTIELDKTKTLKVVPTDGTISRNVTFSLSFAEDIVSTTDVDEAGLQLENLTVKRIDGCDVYVRVWIDAYLATDTAKQTNYGKYFLFKDNANALVQGAEKYNVDTEQDYSINSHSYFVKNALTSSSPTCKVGAYLQLSDLYDEVPIDIVGEQLEIYISFQAVQASNDAFRSEFNDDLGFSEHWS